MRKKHVTAHSNSGVRIASLKVTGKRGWDPRFVIIDDDGDIYISDRPQGDPEETSVMVEKTMAINMIRAFKIATDS